MQGSHKSTKEVGRNMSCRWVFLLSSWVHAFYLFYNRTKQARGLWLFYNLFYNRVLYLQRSVFQFARKTLLYSLCSALNCTMNHTDGINFCVVHAKLNTMLLQWWMNDFKNSEVKPTTARRFRIKIYGIYCTNSIKKFSLMVCRIKQVLWHFKSCTLR